MIRYTVKQIEKFNRQKIINELEKISKNLFRMFRDDSVIADVFVQKFRELKVKYDSKEEIHLDSEYHQHLKAYILRLYHDTCENEVISDKRFEDIRDAEMSNLNRLQKLKNGTSYKKDKHKHKEKNEDWGD